MANTFPDRRQHAVKLRTPVKKFLQLYPALKNTDEIWLEMDRLNGHLEEPESKLATHKTRLQAFMDAAQLLTSCEDVDEEKVEALLEFIFVQPSHIFAGDDGVDIIAPIITGQTLHVERHFVPEVPPGTAASDKLLLWAACFPIYHQKVPSTSAKNALIFIKEDVFEKRIGKCMPNRAVDRLDKLRSTIRSPSGDGL